MSRFFYSLKDQIRDLQREKRKMPETAPAIDEKIANLKAASRQRAAAYEAANLHHPLPISGTSPHRHTIGE